MIDAIQQTALLIGVTCFVIVMVTDSDTLPTIVMAAVLVCLFGGLGTAFVTTIIKIWSY